MLLQRCVLHKDCNAFCNQLHLSSGLSVQCILKQHLPYPPQLLVCRPLPGIPGNTKLLLQPPYPNQFLFSAPLPWKQLLLCHCRCHWSRPWFRGDETSVWWFPLQLALSNVWQFSIPMALPGMLIQKAPATAYFQPKEMELCTVLLPQI